MNIYNINGQLIFDKNFESFADNMDIDYKFDSNTNANFTAIRIYKRRTDGTTQYPFVFAPENGNAGTRSTLQMMQTYNWVFGINAGIFNINTTIPDGVIIQNGVQLHGNVSATTYHAQAYPLTIDSDGNLSYAQPNPNIASLISSGIKSAVCGFCPIIIDYAPTSSEFYEWMNHDDQNVQRQIIGQFGNGDYCFVTCEGRNYDHSDGWTIPEAQAICQELGLKFAYNLDGGGSTETVLGKKQINTIYEGTSGRMVPTFIVFNGTNQFYIPNA